MSRERFQSETGQSIDDNCWLFFGNTSPLFYTVNPRSGVSLRQQEQLGAPSILKSFRDLPGCTRLSSSLSNLDSTSASRRAQFPLLPDINHKGNMGKSLQGHHSSSKRFVRERYNPPFKVNAKIRHVYTQEVTTIEGHGQPGHHQQSQNVITCHRQTQTESELFPESKQKPETKNGVDQENSEKENDNGSISEEKVTRSESENYGSVSTTTKESVNRVDASTSPIPSPYFPDSAPSNDASSNPFSGCSQMTVYPPLNYVRKLEDLEKITGHIVIQRFFTRTDDAFGTWLEKQLGMTSKSVSVDTSEFENAKTAELQDDDEENEEKLVNDSTEAVIMEEEEEEEANSTTNARKDEKEDLPIEPGHEEVILGAVNNPGEGDVQEENLPSVDDTLEDNNADCAFADPIKCECYMEEIERADEYDRVKEIEEQIIVPVEAPETATSEDVVEATSPPQETNNENDDDEVETLISLTARTEESEMNHDKPTKGDEDIDEVVRCTLEAYLLAPMSSFEDIHKEDKENELEGGEQNTDAHEVEENGRCTSPQSAVKSEVDSGRADSIQSQDKMGLEGSSEVEGNTSHDSVETVYELPLISPKVNSEMTLGEKPENGSHVLQRSLSIDSCIGTESSGDVKNQTTNASQSSNDTIEGLDLAPKEISELSLPSPQRASAPSRTSKLPPISTAAKTVILARRLSSAKSHRSMTPCSPRDAERVDSRRNKTDAEAEDADGESETESEITDHFILPTKIHKHHTDGTDLELEEVDEDEGDNDDRDAFDTMVANHLKYSRGLPTATNRRSKLNRGTQTTKSIEPSTTSGSISPYSSSNSSFDVEIISKSKRITTASSSAGGGEGPKSDQHRDMITPSNMTLAWHEGGRRRSYLPSSSSSLNLLNMKFSLGKDFESEVSIRMPANTKSSANNNASASSMLLPGSGGTTGRTLMSSSSRTNHHHLYQNRGMSPSNPPSQVLNRPFPVSQTHNHGSATSLNTPSMRPVTAETNELQSLWKDVKTKLDVQMDEMVSIIPEEENTGGLHVKGSGILPTDPLIRSESAAIKLRRNEERIKRSLQRLKKILDD